MSDRFWTARTEDAGGLVRTGSMLPAADEWRLLRLTQELTGRRYHRSGLLPQPRPADSLAGDLDTVALVCADCVLPTRTVALLSAGSLLTAGTRPGPDGCGWSEWADEVEAALGLDEGPVHTHCLHARADAAFPLMWQVGLLLRTPGAWPAEVTRRLATMTWAEVTDHVGGLTAAASETERAGRWVVLRTRTGWCALSPTGRAFTGDHVLDLAARHRCGAGPGALAAAVEDRMAWVDLTPQARRRQHLTRVAGHAGLPTAAFRPAIAVPDELTLCASDTELVVLADLDASAATVDAALAYGLGLADDQDLTVVLPAGREQRTLQRCAFLNVGVRVWLHDGYRVTPAPIPPRDEVLTGLRRDAWSPAPGEDLFRVRRSTRDGPQTIALATNGRRLESVHHLHDPGPTTVLDCLDRMLWVTAVRDELPGGDADQLGHRIVLAAAPGMPRLHPFGPAQIEALDAGPLVVQQAPGYGASERPAPPRAGLRRRTLITRDLPAAASPAEREAACHPSAFAHALFAPPGATGAAEILRALDLPADRAEPPAFAADHVLLTGTTADGGRVAAVVLVRLTESDFAPCAGYHDPANHRRDACRTNAPFGGDMDACHLRRRSPIGYPRLITVTNGPSLHRSGWWLPDGGCPFRRVNEPLRALARAEELRSSRAFDRVVVTLCAPASAEAIGRRWQEAGSVLRSTSGITLSSITAEAVLTRTDHPGAETIRDRYGIGADERTAAG